MEKRVLSNRFCMRLATTLMGMVFVDAFFALKHFSNDPSLDFRAEMEKLALHLASAMPKKKSSPSSSAARSAARSCSSPSTTSTCEEHVLVPLSSLGKSYKGGKQQRCNICNRKTSWVCATCTQGPHALWPCCPEITRKRGKGHGAAVRPS